MNISSKLFLSLVLSMIPCSSFCSDSNTQKLHELQTASHVPQNMVVVGLLTATIGGLGYAACDYVEQFLCGPHSETPAFSPCNGNETNKWIYTRMISTGLSLAITGALTGGYQQLSALDAQNTKKDNRQ